MELFPLTSIRSIVGTEAAASSRRCGECTACCDGWLKINVYGVEVYPGHPCLHSSGHHCLIYERRPLDPCQRFFCGWLVPTSPLPDWLRPDKAKVIFLHSSIGTVSLLMLQYRSAMDPMTRLRNG